jgi:4-amino-4-deoxy-L-arabinose transferase-like glycosyltransferase
MKKLIVLAIIISIGAIFRFSALGSVPNSLNWDEVSWGYNAYSILHTGHDEHGKFLPLSFQAFGDYKQPVYVYLDTLPIALFGLNAFAVRFPSAFMGVLSILFVYLLTCEVFFLHKRRWEIASVTAFLFAISPWSIQFSRVAFEANIGLAFVILGAWLFIKGLHEKRHYYLIIALLPLAISGYTYHSEKIFTPLFFFGLLVYGFRYFKTKKVLLLLLCLVYIFLNLFWLLDMRTTARGRSVLFTSQQTQVLSHSAKEMIADQQNNTPLGSVIHNRRVVYLNKYLENYLTHFDLNYLFVTGSDATHHAPGMGMLYLIEFPFIVLGIILLIRRKEWSTSILFYWFLLGPVAAALAIDPPNASRSMIILPTWQLFSAVSLVYLYDHLRSKRVGQGVLLLIAVAFSLNILYYAHQYFSHTNSEYSEYWQYGYEQAVHEASMFEKEGKTVFFSPSFEQPYIFYLFYTQYDPAKYLASGGSVHISNKCYSIERVYFGDCSEKVTPGDILIQSVKDNKRSDLTTLKEYLYPNNKIAVRVTKKD